MSLSPANPITKGWCNMTATNEETLPCTWLVETYNEWSEGEVVVVECGAHVTLLGGGGYRCDNGHEHLGIEAELAPFGPEWEREQQDRMDCRW